MQKLVEEKKNSSDLKYAGTIVSDLSPRATHNNIGEKDQDEFPEGGRGWLVVVGGFFILVTTFGMVNTFGQYQYYYEKEFKNENSGTIALIGSLQPAIIYLTSIPVIGIINSIGVNKTLLIGTTIITIALILLSFCKSIWEFYLVQGVLFGFGAGIMFFTAMAIPSEWFKRRRATAVGMAASGSSIGGLVWPIALRKLVEKFGFAWGNRILAFVFLPLLLFSSFAVTNRLPIEKQQFWPDWRVCKDWRFMLICVASTLGFVGLFTPLFYLVTFANKLGLDESTQHYILSIDNALSMVGRLGPPLLADKLGRLNVLTPCVFLIGILQFALWIPARNESMLVAFAVVWGAASGSYQALVPPTITQLFGIEGNKSRLSICFLLATPASLAGPAIAGALIPSNSTDINDFNRIAYFGGSIVTLSSLIFLFVRLSINRKVRVFL